MQLDYLPAEPQGKPKNTGVGSLSLLQEIFPTQESDWGLLHCRWILHQLSYHGSPQNVNILEKPLLKMFIVLSNGPYVQTDFHKNLMTAKIYPSKITESISLWMVTKNYIIYCFILFYCPSDISHLFFRVMMAQIILYPQLKFKRYDSTIMSNYLIFNLSKLSS